MNLLDGYHEELEYDLLTLPSPIDLLDLYRGRLSTRRLWVIIRGLPMSSRLKRAINPEAAAEAEWTPTTYLLAEQIDFEHGVNHNKRLTTRIPRPGEAAAKRAEQEEAMRRLLELEERNRAREISSHNGA